MLYTIYRITIAEHIYIGSTKDFNQRKMSHKSKCNTDCNWKLYQTINQNGGWDCSEMIPIEQFECLTAMDALIREEFWRREYSATLNSRRAHRTKEEHKEQLKIINDKRDSISKKCVCGGTFCYSNKTHHERSKKHKEYLLTLENVVIIKEQKILVKLTEEDFSNC